MSYSDYIGAMQTKHNEFVEDYFNQDLEGKYTVDNIQLLFVNNTIIYLHKIKAIYITLLKEIENIYLPLCAPKPLL